MEVILAVQVKTGYEKKIQAILMKCCEKEITRQQINILTTALDFKLCNRLHKKDRILLPGYILIKCGQFTAQLHYQIKRVPGVIRILRETIPQAEISRLVENARIEVIKNYRSAVEELAKQKGVLKTMFKKMFKYKKVKTSFYCIRSVLFRLKGPQFIFYLE